MIAMPIQKFRSIEEMNAAPEPPADTADRIAYVWALALTMGRPLPRGVARFRSIDELKASRERHGRSSATGGGEGDPST